MGGGLFCSREIERRGGSEGKKHRPLRVGDYSEPRVRRAQAEGRAVKLLASAQNKLPLFMSGDLLYLRRIERKGGSFN